MEQNNEQFWKRESRSQFLRDITGRLKVDEELLKNPLGKGEQLAFLKI